MCGVQRADEQGAQERAKADRMFAIDLQKEVAEYACPLKP